MWGKAVALVLLAVLLLTGCWDRLEMEDQLFPVMIAVDRGERSRYRVTVRIPHPAGLRAGILGARAEGWATVMEHLGAEADTVIQAVYILNAAAARRITLRHLRGILVGESLARAGLHDLLAELMRNGEVHDTIGFWVARGSAGEVIRRTHPSGETNPGKINEGFLLVQKGLHMAPPVRLHHVIYRRALLGEDPFAPVMGINPGIAGEREAAPADSAVAGELDRLGENPVEIAGTAVFRDDRLAGFLTVDETQALLALRGEMGKAYITLPDPLAPERRMTIRFQQENLPQYRTAVTPEGPVVRIRLLFEGEVLSGDADYTREPVRIRVEAAANRFMRQILQRVLERFREWSADPVGIGLRFRSHFATWDEWVRYDWRSQIANLRVELETEMRIRRFGLIHSGPAEEREEGDSP